MSITRYLPIQTVVNRLYRQLGINTEINESEVIEWTSDALLMIGSYYQFVEKSECLELIDGKAKLPCGFYKLVDIAYQGFPVSWATNQMASNYQCEGCQIPQCCTEFTFYINNDYLITNINSTNGSPDNTNICIVYLSVPVDDNGYPMIPDDIYYMRALESYVTYRMDYREWRKGKLADKVYKDSEAAWLFYVNSARGSANMPNIAELEKLKNIWQRLIPLQGEYNRHFSNLGKQQNRRLH
jgi:hypothetical protein